MSQELKNVINWFLSKDSMTQKKLQKLLYYAYAWVLTLENDEETQLTNKLFAEKFEAWVHGPMIREVYEQYQEFGYNAIPRYEGIIPAFSEEIEGILEDVWEEYGDYSGNELESITHQESPWQKAREGYSFIERCTEEISDQDIFNCYIKRVEFVN